MLRFLFRLPLQVRIALLIFYVAIIAFLSLMPPEDIPKVEVMPNFDKVVHFLMYFGLTLLLCWTAYADQKPMRILLILLVVVLWGLFMEESQKVLALGRSFEWTDELANSFGSLTGGVVFYLVATGHHKK
ncbi:MAG: VanZ family protein [Marinilabiliales bacterium]|nr:VanZ family protein [Marinilabiliales bacterium]